MLLLWFNLDAPSATTPDWREALAFTVTGLRQEQGWNSKCFSTLLGGLFDSARLSFRLGVESRSTCVFWDTACVGAHWRAALFDSLEGEVPSVGVKTHGDEMCEVLSEGGECGHLRVWSAVRGCDPRVSRQGILTECDEFQLTRERFHTGCAVYGIFFHVCRSKTVSVAMNFVGYRFMLKGVRNEFAIIVLDPVPYWRESSWTAFGLVHSPWTRPPSLTVVDGFHIRRSPRRPRGLAGEFQCIGGSGAPASFDACLP